MTPEEAIKTSEGEVAWRRGLGQIQRADAIQLGIEALKLYKEMKAMGEIGESYRLPGETEE